MKRQLLSVLSIVSLFAPVFILFQTQAQSCPVREPETLLDLYRNSTSIHIATFSEEERGEPKRQKDDGDYLITDITRRFDVSSTLKGEAVKSVTLYDSDYDYQPGPSEFKGYETHEEVEEDNRVPETESEADTEDETSDDEDAEDVEEGSEATELAPGVEVLLFLKPGEEKGGVELTDYSDGMKILSRPAMNAYEARIKDLNTIFKKDEPDDEAITAWLVRCAEDPETRWEGTYELERGFRWLDWRAQREAMRKAKIARGETAEVEVTIDEVASTGRSIYAELLSEHHKQTLANLLINANFRVDPKSNVGFTRGDSELVRLVSRWASSRIAAVLVDRVRSGAYAASENREMMDAITSILDDDELSELNDRFGEVAYENDDAVVRDKHLEDANDSEEAQDGEVAKPADPETENSDRDEEKKQKPAPEENTDKAPPAGAEKTVEAPKPTYKQLRSDLMAKFLLTADKVIADPQGHIGEKQKLAVEKLLSEKPLN